MALASKRVLIFAAPYYEELELWYPKIRLEEEGVRTVVAGLGEKSYTGKRGSYPVTVDAHVDDMDTADFDGLIIPGGYAPDILRRSAKVLELTREFFEDGKPIGFICHAGWVPPLAVQRARLRLNIDRSIRLGLGSISNTAEIHRGVIAIPGRFPAAPRVACLGERATAGNRSLVVIASTALLPQARS